MTCQGGRSELIQEQVKKGFKEEVVVAFEVGLKSL